MKNRLAMIAVAFLAFYPALMLGEGIGTFVWNILQAYPAKDLNVRFFSSIYLAVACVVSAAIAFYAISCMLLSTGIVLFDARKYWGDGFNEIAAWALLLSAALFGIVAQPIQSYGVFPALWTTPYVLIIVPSLSLLLYLLIDHFDSREEASA
jgi:hypothetical protein